MEPFEQSLKSFQENTALFEGKLTASFSDEVVQQFSQLWNKSEEATLKKLTQSIHQHNPNSK